MVFGSQSLPARRNATCQEQESKACLSGSGVQEHEVQPSKRLAISERQHTGVAMCLVGFEPHASPV
jgi:L-fucose isomerase-like protein